MTTGPHNVRVQSAAIHAGKFCAVALPYGADHPLMGCRSGSGWERRRVKMPVRGLLIRVASPQHCQFVERLAVNHQTHRQATVRVKENESFDIAMRRFKRSCEKAGILTEIRRREFYEKPTSVRKRKAAAAVKRHLKKLAREQARMTQRRY